MKTKLSVFFLLLVAAAPSHAQGVRFGDGQPIFSAQFPGGPIFSVQNPVISFCNSPANQVPCTNKVTTFTDGTLSSQCSTSTQLVLAGTNQCVGTGDSFGNWGVWVPVGTYAYTVTLSNGSSLGPYTVTLASGGGGGGIPTLTSSHIFVGNASNVATDTVLSGDATLSNAGVLTLASTGVTAATYTNPTITVDLKGRIVTASSGSVSGVTATGSPLANELAMFSGSNSITNSNLSGDVTTNNTLVDQVAAIQGLTVTLTSPALGQTFAINSIPALVNAYPGVPVDVQAGASYTLKGDGTGSDRVNLLNTTNGAGNTLIAVPQVGSAGFGSNFTFAHCNSGLSTAIDTPSISTVNGNLSLSLLPQAAGNNPECAFWWSTPSQNWLSAVILPTDSSGRLHASGFPQLTGDVTTAPSSTATTLANVNSSVGTFTNATVTLDAKGRATFAANGAGGGGGGGGQIDYQTPFETPITSVGFSITGATTVGNTGTPTSLVGASLGRQIISSYTMLPSTNGPKTYRIYAAGTVSTFSSTFVLTVKVLLGGVTVSTITAPTIASLSAAGWQLESYFTVTGLTTATSGGCMTITGTASAALIGCASSAAVSGLNFGADQLLDLQVTWTTANAANTITVNELTAAPVQSI